MDYTSTYEIKCNHNKQNNSLIVNKQYGLKKNNFNPTKDSPNLFMTNLEHRMKTYYLEAELNNDVFILDTR